MHDQWVSLAKDPLKGDGHNLPHYTDEIFTLKCLMQPTIMPMQPVAVSAPSALRLKEGDEVSSLLILLDASEDHLRPRDVLLGIHQVLEHVLVRPHDPGVLVGLRVCETLASARGAAHDAPQGRALLRVATLLPM